MYLSIVKKSAVMEAYIAPPRISWLWPFTWEARQMILRRLLQTQKQMNYELITIDELRAIDRIWDEEQDLSCRVLVNLYYDEMGERLPWMN